MTDNAYRGRFAPSPTGPLHFGSLVTALASYLEARTHTGDWLIRIEDLDPLREPPEATRQILDSLQAHQLISPEQPRLQSARHPAYEQAIRQLLDNGRAYYCTCSRKQLKANDGRHPNGCRNRQQQPPEQEYAIRFALEDEIAVWQDQLLGEQRQAVRGEIDDPVLQRKEGFYAYQLAVVVDDIDQRISHVVRGSDLLPLTAQQQQIFRALGSEPPAWLHIPVILNNEGQKLSKQTHATAIDDLQPEANLLRALRALGQQPPASLDDAAPSRVLDWALENWQPGRIPVESRSEGEVT
jgi:glutamyl-Q tRNA(Asp) synthetase